MTTEDSKKYIGMPVVEILQKIKAKTLDAAILPKETRLACVEALILEGHQQTAIASLFKTSDRTIRRDVADIRKKNSLEASPELTRELVGDFLTLARSHHGRLKQIGRMCTVPEQMAKVEYLAWRVYKDVIEGLHAIGFLVVGTVANEEIEHDLKMTKPEYELPVDRELERQYKALGPMDREKLIEGIQREVMKRDKEITEENSTILGQIPPPESK